jgi:cytochrome c553
MRTLILVTATLSLVLLCEHHGNHALAQGAPEPPPWAYPMNPPRPPGAPPAPAPDATVLHTVPGSDQSLTMAQIRSPFDIADWHPEGHPAMPEVVSHGRRPEVRACGYCHYPNGKGRPENAGIAGLPAAYIVQQMADFKSGARKSSEPRMVPPNLMVDVANAATDEEVRIAAEYFAALPWTPWITVVEATTVPTTTVMGGMIVPLEGAEAGEEPLGQRIIEVPMDTERAEVLRDDSASFVAYVPVGSIDKGEALVTTGGGRTIQCSVCHGANLEGVGSVPPLAGRSPSYTVRQLFDIQQGSRAGFGAEQMKQVVAALTLEDMIHIAAYTGSRVPPAANAQ